MAFVAALQRLFKDYETLLNDYKPISALETPLLIKNATKKQTLDKGKGAVTLLSVSQKVAKETEAAAEIQPISAEKAAEIQLPPAETAAEIQLPPVEAAAVVEALPAETTAEIQPLPAKKATEVKSQPDKAAAEVKTQTVRAEIQPLPAKAAAEVKLQPAKAAAVVEAQTVRADKAKDYDVKQISTILPPIIPKKSLSTREATNNMKSSFRDSPLRAHPGLGLNINYFYGAPQDVRPAKINHSSFQDIKESMERENLESRNKRKADKAERQKTSIYYDKTTGIYDKGYMSKKSEVSINLKQLLKKEKLKKQSELDFETQKKLQDQKIKKAVGIKSCCSKSELSDQLYDGIPIKICEKKDNFKTYPDSFFNCFVDFFFCIGLYISEKKLRTLVSMEIEKNSFSEEELNNLYDEIEVNVELLGKSMGLEKEKMRNLLNGPESLKHKLSKAITENFVQVGDAIYPFMNRVLENFKKNDFIKKTLLVGDSDDAEVLSDNDWLENSTNEDFSFTIGGKMYSNLEFVVIVGYKQSKINKNGTLETTIRYVLENNKSSESNDRLVLIQSAGFLYDLCFVESEGERVFIMDKTKIFAKTSEKLIKEEKLVRKEKEKQLEVVNEKIKLLDNNMQENINEIINIKNQNKNLHAAIDNNYNRNYYKETKNCNNLTIVGFISKIYINVLQEIENTTTDDDTIDSLEIKFLAKMNEKISKKRSAKYDCRIENINDEYILITENTGINTPRVKKHKPVPTNPLPLSTTTNLVLNAFETKILAKIKDFWRRNTQSLDKNIFENEHKQINLNNLNKDINKEKNELIKDKGVIEKELSVLKISLEKKIDQLQETKSSPAVNTVTPVLQLPEKEKVADVPTSDELKECYELEKKHGNQIDLNKVTMNVQKHVYIPGMFKGL